jgi:AcrR family transcriptional regulator
MIARVALTAFLDEGYDATTMTTIASLAGVGRKTVFTYFSSKAEIVWRGFDPIHARFVEFLEADRDSSPSSAIARCAARAATVFPAGMGTLRAETLLVEDHQELRGHGEMRSRRWVRTVVEDAHPETTGSGSRCRRAHGHGVVGRGAARASALGTYGGS